LLTTTYPCRPKTVTAKDLIRRDEEGEDGEQRGPGDEEEGQKVAATEDVGVGEDNDKDDGGDDFQKLQDLPLVEDTEFVALQLRESAPNGSRRVPPACAICLCPYEVDDLVTHSPREDCQHAFHHECVTTWLAKKPQPLCPCCRQVFCEMPNPSGMTTTTTTTTIGGTTITTTTTTYPAVSADGFLSNRGQQPPQGAFNHFQDPLSPGVAAVNAMET